MDSYLDSMAGMVRWGCLHGWGWVLGEVGMVRG